MTSGPAPEVAGVAEFIAPRQRAVDSGELAWFRETEIDGVSAAFGNVAHRLSRYRKEGRRDGVDFTGRGMISTQFVRTPAGWRISVMAWDDERPGLTLPEAGRQGNGVAWDFVIRWSGPGRSCQHRVHAAAAKTGDDHARSFHVPDP